MLHVRAMIATDRSASFCDPREQHYRTVSNHSMLRIRYSQCVIRQFVWLYSWWSVLLVVIFSLSISLFHGFKISLATVYGFSSFHMATTPLLRPLIQDLIMHIRRFGTSTGGSICCCILGVKRGSTRCMSSTLFLSPLSFMERTCEN